MPVDENFLVQWLQKNDSTIMDILSKIERIETAVADISAKQREQDPEHEFLRALQRLPKVIAWIVSISVGMIGLVAFFRGAK